VNLKESQCITLGKEVILLIQGKLASNAQFVEHGLYSEEEEEEEEPWMNGWPSLSHESSTKKIIKKQKTGEDIVCLNWKVAILQQ